MSDHFSQSDATAAGIFGATPDALPPTADRYDLGPEIARGGMGVVHTARDTVLHRDVAVKVLRADLRDRAAAAARFVEEARIAARLPHPGVAPVHDLGALPDGRPFLAMKLIKGRTLADLLAARPAARAGEPAADLPHLVQVFEQIAQAVAFAHSRQVIHRDLKPANVMVGAFAEVQVMDWGLAKILTDAPPSGRYTPPTEPDGEPMSVLESDRTGDSATQAGSLLGTPAYMPPEQAKGDIGAIGYRADVFALGAVLCEVLTGKPPYTGSSDEVRAQALLGRTDDALARLDGCGADPELVALCKRCLAADPIDRPADAGAVARAVAALRHAADERARQAELDRVKAEGEAVAAEARAAEQRRKRRWQLLAAAAAVVIAGLVGSGLWWQDAQARERRAEADRAEADRRADRAEADARQSRAEVDRAQALARAEAGVGEAIKLAAALRDAAQFDGAQTALDQAEKLLPPAGADDLRDGLRRAAADLALARELDEVRMIRADFDSFQAYATAVQRYSAAFAGRGMDIEGGDPAAVAARVRASPVYRQLVDALDDWSLIRHASAGRARAVAQLADPGPIQDRLRDPVLHLTDQPAAAVAAVTRLAREIDLGRMSLAQVASLMELAWTTGAQVDDFVMAATVRHRTDFWVQFFAGNYWSTVRQPGRAALCYMAAVAVRPNSPLALCNMGARMRATGDVPAAVPLLDAAVALKPTYSAAYANRGLCYEAMGDWPRATADHARAAELAPAHAQCQFRWLAALAHDPDPGQFAAAYPVVAHRLIGAVPYSSSLPVGKRTITLREKVQLLLANTSPAGLALCRRGTEARPESADGWLLYAQVLYAARRDDEAAAALQRALALLLGDPASPAARLADLLLTEMAVESGRADEVIEAYKRALRGGPQDRGMVVYRLAHLLRDQDRLDEAILVFREACKNAPTNAQLRSKYADCLRYACRYHEAVAEYEQAVRIDPKNILAYSNMAFALRGNQELERSVWADRQAATLDPNQVPRLRRSEARLAVVPKLDAWAAGRAEPGSAPEAWLLVEVATYSKKYALGARLYEASLKKHPGLAQLNSVYGCYEAQCAAYAGTGGDPTVAGEAERARFRRLALQWLRAEMADWQIKLTARDTASGASGRRALQMWTMDPHLAAVRDPKALTKLPEAERKEWEAFWAEVRQLLVRPPVAPPPREVKRP